MRLVTQCRVKQPDHSPRLQSTLYSIYDDGWSTLWYFSLYMYTNTCTYNIYMWVNISHSAIGTTQETQNNICITFIQRRPNVFDVGPTFYKCYTNVLFLLGRQTVAFAACFLVTYNKSQTALNPFSAGTDLNRRQNLTSKVGPRIKRIKYLSWI